MSKLTMETLDKIEHLAKEQMILNEQWNNGTHTHFGNGWITVTLNRFVNRPYNEQDLEAEDINFNIMTVKDGFDYYLLPLHLGYYCYHKQSANAVANWELNLRPVRDSIVDAVK